MIKVGTNVKSKVHDDLTGHVVICQPLNNYAVIMTDIIEYEMMTVCLLYTSPSPRDKRQSRMPSSA